MRVTHLVCSTGFAGVERYIVNTASGLAAHGIDVKVIGGSPAHVPAALAETPVTWLPGSDMREAWKSLRTTRLPDILHTHMSQADLIGALGAIRPSGRNTRHVSTRHFAGPRGGNAIARAFFAVAAGTIDAEIAISSYVAAHARGRIDIVRSGVVAADAATTRERFVLVAQRLEPEKFTADAIDAWAQCTGPRKGWTLRIAGEGSERSQLEKKVRECKIADSVEFLGHRDDVPALLSRAGLVLAPTPREGLGISVLEAMAHGAPVIAAGSGGHLETVGEVSDELLYPAGDTAAAARAIDRLLADADLRESVGRALQAHQRQHFTIERQVSDTVAIYERLCRS